jgi:NDP-sugar pyrophosphorylase family protein
VDASAVVGIGLAGGRGERARPLTVKAPGYLRSKAAMSFLGMRLVRMILKILAEQGLHTFFIVAHGKENRYQIKMLIDHGEPLGIGVRYSRVKFDAINTGSADAAILNADYFDIRGTALVFPTDSVVDLDVGEMAAAHIKAGALVTIGAMIREPTEVAGKYGVMLTDVEGTVLEFVEKPSLEEIVAAFPAPSEADFHRLPLLTNSGFYMVDIDRLREIAEHPDLREMADQRLDFGLDLLPWLVGKGFKVLAHPIGRIGDLGNIRDYISTMVDALGGRFPSVGRLLGPPSDAVRRLWIDPTSLAMTDEERRTTLAEKIDRGLVDIGPGVRIGKYSEIHSGVRLADCNIDDGVEIHEGATIVRSSVRDGATIGRSAVVQDSYVGSMAEVRSTPQSPTIVEDGVALGDEVVLQPGVRLAGDISLYPRVHVPAAAHIPSGMEIRNAEDLMRYL